MFLCCPLMNVKGPKFYLWRRTNVGRSVRIYENLKAGVGRHLLGPAIMNEKHFSITYVPHLIFLSHFSKFLCLPVPAATVVPPPEPHLHGVLVTGLQLMLLDEIVEGVGYGVSIRTLLKKINK